MQVQSSRFGLLEIDESTVINFPWGLPAFEDIKHYALLQHEDGPLHWLHAIDDPKVAFVVCPPEYLGYRYEIPREKLAPIHLERPEDLVVLVMVSFNRHQKSVRPHLRGPLLFNVADRLAYQWSMDSREAGKYIIVQPAKSLAEDLLSTTPPPE